MAVTAADVLAPEGEVQPAQFPDAKDAAEVTAAVQAIVDAAAAQAVRDGVAADDRDAATVALAHYKAARATYLRLSALPSTVAAADDASGSYLLSQIDSWRTTAAEYLARYEAYLPPPAAASLETPSATVNVPLTFVP